MVAQAEELTQKPHLVIATPGRLVDHLESGTKFSIDKIRFLVLDEADRMLSGGFNNEVKLTYAQVINKRLLVSWHLH